jgi:hypothetical protein
MAATARSLGMVKIGLTQAFDSSPTVEICFRVKRVGHPCRTAGNKEKLMKSDFAAAHLHLERACHYLRGDDETSHKTRAALDLLIEAIAVAQYTRPIRDVVEFPRSARLR